jgi:hypothetical protein
MVTLAGCGSDAGVGAVLELDVAGEADGAGGRDLAWEPDQAAGDPATPPETFAEAGGEDAGELPPLDLLEPGEFGYPCAQNSDCLSGYCMFAGAGKVCSKTCMDDCPEGWSCVLDSAAAPDVVYVCVPSAVAFCAPCTGSDTCNPAGISTGAECIDFGETGAFCGALCTADGDCPQGSSCQEVSLLSGAQGKQCVPDGRAGCKCSPFAMETGAWTHCHVSNDHGTCAGTRACSQAGLSPCDAAAPAPESCNALDDDCDGQGDEDLGEIACGLGQCAHSVPACKDGQEQVCDPMAGSTPEGCNAKDDDCDGETDEGFKDSDLNGIPDCYTPDDDGDGIEDTSDNCPTQFNPDQEDFDSDNFGDACDSDDDNDKTPDEADCQPFDDQVHPGVPEVCNGKDDDCSGLADDGLGEATCGVGSCSHTQPNCLAGQPLLCDPLEGMAAETCDGLDNDCDGTPDDGFADLDKDGFADCIDPDDDGDSVADDSDNCPLLPNPTQADADGDGFGDECDLGCFLEGLGEFETDCDSVPEAADNCPKAPNPDQADADADGAGDACDLDDDGDGIPDSADNCQLVSNPGQTDFDKDGLGDACDGDLDGDGTADQQDNCPLLKNPGQADADQDGEGDACDPDDDNDTDPDVIDCEPFDPAISHLVPETCNGLDDDCDSVEDEANAVGCQTWYVDMDQDGYGVKTQSKCLCGPQELYTVQQAGDCKPLDDSIFPGAPEICNGLDEDCSGKPDETFPDLDGDGSADCVDLDDDGDGVADAKDNCPAAPNASQGDFDQDGVGNVCDADDDNDAVADVADCAPFDPTVNPAAPELCDGKDNDCDGPKDEQLGTTTCGLGICLHAVENCVAGIPQACDPMEGAQEELCDGKDNDCDGKADNGFPVGLPCTAGLGQCADEGIVICLADGSGTTCSAETGKPHAELCDGKDNDCDSKTDEDFPLGKPCSVGIGQCTALGTLVCKADGLDTACSAQPFPAFPEFCDGKDNDCDGKTDEELGNTTCGLGECVHEQVNCIAGVPQVCNPKLGAAKEVCDGLDNDCDGKLTDEEADADKDGQRACQGDCNDLNNSVFIGAPEFCDAVDSDCDGDYVDGFPDFDADLKPDCSDDDDDGDGFLDSVDCQPLDPSSYPGAAEVCDNKDNNCNGQTDEAGLGGCIVFYHDGDGDGWGTSDSKCLCQADGLYKASKPGDCNDGNAGINPGAAEACGNAADEDCDNQMSEGCPEYFHDCGGPGALDAGQGLDCDLGAPRLVHRVRVSVGCNDGETGNYTVSFNDGSSVNFGAGCGTEYSFSQRTTTTMHIHMHSGGGGDNHISWTCCGSSGWGVWYK